MIVALVLALLCLSVTSDARAVGGHVGAGHSHTYNCERLFFLYYNPTVSHLWPYDFRARPLYSGAGITRQMCADQRIPRGAITNMPFIFPKDSYATMQRRILLAEREARHLKTAHRVCQNALKYWVNPRRQLTQRMKHYAFSTKTGSKQAHCSRIGYYFDPARKNGG
jgi:hypothetical protein